MSVYHNSYLLLGSLLLLIILSPVLENVLIGRYIMDSLFFVVLLTAILALDVNRVIRALAIVSAFVLLGIRLTGLFVIGDAWFLPGYIVYVGLIFLAFISLMRTILTAKVIDLGVILDAISAYLLIGVSWAMIFLIIHTLIPSAFDFAFDDGYQLWSRYVYLSFMTLTTLGYGDITSTNSIVQIWSVLEAIVGVLFQATLIARLVSAYGTRQ